LNSDESFGELERRRDRKQQTIAVVTLEASKGIVVAETSLNHMNGARIRRNISLTSFKKK
jgi:hypothetical protein